MEILLWILNWKQRRQGKGKCTYQHEAGKLCYHKTDQKNCSFEGHVTACLELDNPCAVPPVHQNQTPPFSSYSDKLNEWQSILLLVQSQYAIVPSTLCTWYRPQNTDTPLNTDHPSPSHSRQRKSLRMQSTLSGWGRKATWASYETFLLSKRKRRSVSAAAVSFTCRREKTPKASLGNVINRTVLFNQIQNTKGNRVPMLQWLLGLWHYHDKNMPQQQGVLWSQNESSVFWFTQTQEREYPDSPCYQLYV